MNKVGNERLIKKQIENQEEESKRIKKNIKRFGSLYIENKNRIFYI